jgi:PKD repeat protein
MKMMRLTRSFLFVIFLLFIVTAFDEPTILYDHQIDFGIIIGVSVAEENETQTNGTPPIAVVEIPKTSGPTLFPFSFKGSNSYDTDPDDDVVKFHWDFGDGIYSMEADATHSYNKHGMYKVVLTVYDRKGNINMSDEFEIKVVNRCESPSLNLLNEGRTYMPIKMSATAQDPDGKIVGYKWDFGDGTNNQFTDWCNCSKPDHIYAKPGTYTVIVWIKDNLGKVNMSSGVIRIMDYGGGGPYIQVIQLSGSTPPNYSYVFREKGFYQGIESYHWYFGDGEESTLANPVHEYKTPGEYNVKLTVVDNYGNTDEYYNSLKVESTPDGSLINDGRYNGLFLYIFIVVVPAIFLLFLLLAERNSNRN